MVDEKQEMGGSDAALQYFRKRAQNVWIHFGRSWMANVRANLVRNMKGQTAQVSDLVTDLDPTKRDARTIYLFAAGPSLRRYEDRIAEIPKGIVVATPTVLPWLRRHGIEPDWLVISDSNKIQAKAITGSGGARLMRLVTSPIIHPDVVKLFPKENRHWFVSVIQSEDGTINHEPFSTFMMYLFPELVTYVVQAGCVTNQAAILLHHMMNEKLIGAKRILLLGADYGYPNGLSRVPSYAKADHYEVDGTVWMPAEYSRHEPDADDMAWRMDDDRLLLTNRRMALYARSFYIWWGHAKPPVYGLDPYLLYHVPSVTFAQVLSDRFPRDLTKEDKYEKARRFCAEEFPTQFAQAFRESEAPDKEDVQGGEQGEGKGSGIA